MQESFLPSQLSGEIQERLLKVIIALCGNLIVLEILLPVECNLFCFDLPVLDINLVSTQNNGDILTDPDSSPLKTFRNEIKHIHKENRKRYFASKHTCRDPGAMSEHSCMLTEL